MRAACLLAAAWVAAAADGRYRLRLEPEPAPGEWNSFHAWRLSVQPAEGIEEIRFDGRMPAHGHGFAVQPRITALGGGAYRAEGVRFHMSGEWEIEFAVRGPAGWEKLTKNLDPGLERFSLRTLGSVPADPGNRVSLSPEAAAIGKRLFFDERLSGNGRISCATCHRPELHYTDGKALAEGIGRANRHTPTVVGAAWASWLFWDGRRDSLWSQALGPIESPVEMGSSRVRVAGVVKADSSYRNAFHAIFGSDPMSAPVDETFANTGKAIAAWEATLRPEETRFDRGELTAREQAGFRLFLDDRRTGCARCHNGPLFTNQQFHNVGSGPPARAGTPPDFGRLIGLQALTFDEFQCGSRYSDDQRCSSREFAGRDNHGDLLEGAFKVPSLRAVSKTAPYFHDGRYRTLRDVLEHYRKPPAHVRHELIPVSGLSDRELGDLEAFLRSL